MSVQPRHEGPIEAARVEGTRVEGTRRGTAFRRRRRFLLAGALLLAGCGRAGETSDPVPGPLAAPQRAVAPALVSVAEPDDPSAESASPVMPVAFAEGSETAGSVKGITFDDIKFEIKKEDKFKQRMLTEKITSLFEKKVRIRGYILPSYKDKGLTRLVLMRDNKECCFGPGAAIYDCIVVDMVGGNTADFSVRQVTVEGKFSFQKLEDPSDGALRAIYHLDGESVK